jgi:hypothetical protein
MKNSKFRGVGERFYANTRILMKKQGDFLGLLDCSSKTAKVLKVW